MRLAFTFLLFVNICFAQEPCVPIGSGLPANGPGGCLLCFPTYQGSTAGYTASGVPATYPIHNDQWITVIADGSGSINAAAIPTNCQDGNGLDLFILDANLVELGRASAAGPGMPIPLGVAIGNTIEGNVYYIRIDGFLADICDFTLTVTGIQGGSPLVPSGPMVVEPDTTLCPGAQVCYSINSIDGATEYGWRVPANAVIISGGSVTDTSVCVRYPTSGGGVVSVQANNLCFNGVPQVTPVAVTPIPPDFKPPIFVCDDEFPITIDGNVFQTTGAHNVNYKTGLNCDSTVTYTLIPKTQTLNAIDTAICMGSCFMVGDTCISDAGVHDLRFDDTLAQKNGCDSLVRLVLEVFEPIAVISPPAMLDCDPNATVVLNGNNSSSGNNVIYEWTTAQGGNIQGAVNTNSATATSTGQYILSVSQINSSGFICIATDTVVVTSSAQVPNAPVFNNPDTMICIGEMMTYNISPVNLANDYVWSVPAASTFSGSGTSIMVDFGMATSGEVCVFAVGDCGNSPLSCKTITFNPIPTADFTSISPICITNTTTFQYTGTASSTANFNWNFNGGTSSTATGSGPHEVSWTSPGTKNITLTVEENGCTSTQMMHVVEVESELAIPVISCTSSSGEITFSWGGIAASNGYSISIDGGAPMMQSDTFITQTGLSPNQMVDISVTAIGAGQCGNSMNSTTCTAQNCPTVDLNIQTVNDICLDGNATTLQLQANPTGGTGGGTLVWSGSGTDASGLFNPQNANQGANTISLTYNEGTCIYTDFITINVFQQPDATFTFDSPICENETSTITYTGSASATATYNWDFINGTIVSGTGVGPYEIQWPTGIQNLTLTVEENGCSSPMNLQSVNVDPLLMAPVIRCLSTSTNTIIFEWDEIAGANNYIINGPGNEVVDFTNRTITVDGLSQGDMITIEVIAEGNSVCGSSSNTFTCQASNCPTVNIDITSVGPFCEDDSNNQPIQVQASAGSNLGTFDWTGAGVDQNGIFNPNDAAVNAGTLQLQVTYTEGNCVYNDVLNIEILEKPTSDFTADSPICINETSTLNYTGSTPLADLTFNWDLDDGQTNNLGGTQEGTWTSGGLKNITLVTSKDGCFSALTTQTVQVDEPLTTPVINCTASQNSVSFDWDLIPEAISYNVNLLSGPAGIFNGTNNYSVSNLSPGDEVVIELIITGNTECGPLTTPASCIAQNCPPIFVSLNEVDPICLDGRTTSLNLGDSILVVDGAGLPLNNSSVLNWHDGSLNNDYVSNNGRFFPAQAGSGTIPIAVDVEYPSGSGCIQNLTTDIELIAVPNNSILLDTAVCVTDIDTVDLLFLLNGTAISTWDFGMANVVSGSGAGPYELSWNAPGGFVDTIKVEVDDRGCSSGIFEKTIKVDPQIAPLQITCNQLQSTETSVAFNWNTDPNVSEYEISIQESGGMLQTRGNQTNTDFNESNLTIGSPGVTIHVSTISNSFCGEQIASMFCPTNSCPPIEFTFNITATEFCLGDDPVAPFVSLDQGNSQAVKISGDGFSNNQFDPDIAGVGTHWLFAEYEEMGCFYKDSLLLEVYDLPVVLAGDNQSIDCNVSKVEIGSNTSPSNLDYQWFFNGSSAGNTQLIEVDTFGIFILVGTDPITGCKNSDEVEVDSKVTNPTLLTDVNDISCEGKEDGTITITGMDDATLPFEYSLDGNPFSNLNIFDNLSVGNYKITGRDASGCMGEIEIEIQEGASTILMAEANEISCFGRNDGAITIMGIDNATPPFEFDFEGSGFSTNNVFFDNLAPGRYEIIGRDANGCLSNFDIEIIEPNELTVELTLNIGENPVPLGDSVQLEAIISLAPEILSSIQWTSTDFMLECDSSNMQNCITAWVSPSGQTVYNIQIETASGCVANDEIALTTSSDFPVYFPSAFSPLNQDGINDYFQFYGKPGNITNVKSFLIFDRWGELIFQRKDFQPSLGTDTSNAWNGKFNGKFVNNGIYVFFAEVELADGSTKIFEGDVTVF